MGFKSFLARHRRVVAVDIDARHKRALKMQNILYLLQVGTHCCNRTF